MRLFLRFIPIDELFVKLVCELQDFVGTLFRLFDSILRLLIDLGNFLLLHLSLLFLDLGQRVYNFLLEGAKKLLNFIVVRLTVDFMCNCL